MAYNTDSPSNVRHLFLRQSAYPKCKGYNAAVLKMPTKTKSGR